MNRNSQLLLDAVMFYTNHKDRQKMRWSLLIVYLLSLYQVQKAKSSGLGSHKKKKIANTIFSVIVLYVRDKHLHMECGGIAI